MRLATYLDSKQSRKAANVIVRKGGVLSCVLYLAGLVYLLMLPNESFNRKNFFDENALMAGLVKREFNDLRLITEYAAKLKKVVHSEDMYMEWLEAEFAALGLEVYSQNFSARKLITIGSENSVVKGRNMYGIMRAGRAKSTECIVLASPYLYGTEDNVHGTAVMLALARYFTAKNYWAKDLLFLVTSQQDVGMQAWVDQYKGIQSVNERFGISSGSLLGRSGAIQAVISLEMPSQDIEYVNIIIEGVNGILPNLDLVNVVVYLCHTENVKSAFHDRWDWLLESSLLDYHHQRALYTTLAMASHQAPGLPQGRHAPFLQHRIDSLTMRGVKRSYKGGGTWDMLGVARALEGTFRSINNLLETLHHSEFFYFTAATWRYISIGLYMPPLALLLAPLVLEIFWSVHGLSQWLQARNPHLIVSSSPPSTTQHSLSFPFQEVIQLILFCYGSGVLLCVSPLLAGHVFSPLTSTGLLYSLAPPSLISLLFPLLWRPTVSLSHWKFVKTIAVIFLILTLLALAMTNFSLAVGMSLMLTTPTLLAQLHPPILRVSHQFLILLFSPPLSLLFFAAGYIYFFLPASSHPLIEGVTLTLRGTATSLNAWYFHDSWLFPLCCVGVWPLWLMFWTLAAHRECSNGHQQKLHSQ